MRAAIFICCLVLFYLAPGIQARATPGTPNLTLHNHTQGLSKNIVYSIAQDKEGFIWLATQVGLSRYDGYQIKHFESDPADPESLPHNVVRTLFLDDTDTLWLGTEGGLARFDKTTHKSKTYLEVEAISSTDSRHRIWSIFQTPDKNLWVSTDNNLYVYIPEQDRFKPALTLPTDNGYGVKDIHTSGQELLMGMYGRGLWTAQVQNDVRPGIKLKKRLLAKDVDLVFDIEYIDNNIWVSTDNGIYVLQNNKVIHHFTKQKKARSIIKAQDRVWVGTENGLYILDESEYKLRPYHSTTGTQDIIDNGYIFTLFEDRLENLWLGTYNAGAQKYLLRPSYMTHYKASNKQGQGLSSPYVSDIQESNDGTIWIATESGGINAFYPNNKRFTHYPNTANATIWSIAVGEQYIWASTNQGLKRLDIKSSEYTDLNIQSSVFKQHAKYLYFSDSKLWFGSTKSKLFSLDPSTLALTEYTYKQAGISLNIIGKYQSKFWLGSYNGKIIGFDTVSKQFSEFDISYLPTAFTEPRVALVFENEKELWLSTYGNGLARITKSSHAFTTLTKKSGLSSNNILSIKHDDNQLWIASPTAIDNISLDSGKVNQQKDGLISLNGEFNSASLHSRDGRLYYGSNDGLVYAEPADIKQKERLLDVKVTDLRLLNRHVPISVQSPLQQDIANLKHITLDHNDSPFSLEFASLNPSVPEKVKYKYMLEGLDDHWLETDADNRRSTYTNLSGGDYIFKVQAYLPFSHQTSKITELRITILPPIWLSPLAVLAYSLAVLLLILYIANHIRKRRLIQDKITKSEERLKLSLWGSGDEMWDWNIQTGTIYRSNIWGVLEFPHDGRRSSSSEANIHSQDLTRVQEALNSHFQGSSEHFEATYRVKDVNSRWVWVLDRGKIVERDNQGKPTRMTGTLKDITQIKEAESRLRLFAKSFENISDGVVICDRQFKIAEINQSFSNITGKSRDDVIGKVFRFSQYPRAFTTQIKKAVINTGNWFGEIEEKRKSGEVFQMELTMDVIRDESGEISHFVGVMSDITQRKETEEELRKLSNSDTLTELPNRSFFQANQRQLVKAKTQHALLVFDLDNFKKINDSLGHQAGDSLLCMVSHRLQQLGRSQDTLYRLGGDEFSIILENTNDIHTITSTAKQILKRLSEPFQLNNHEVAVSGSIGIVLFPEDGSSSQELLKNADTAMYHAKNSGGNCYQFFSEQMNEKAVKRLQIENLIRYGLKEDYFTVYYQPKLDLATGRLAGMEALVRFSTPKKGLISPAAFIPVAEETGQIIDIGEIVLKKVCYQVKNWVEQGLFQGRVAVNLSAKQFDLPDLCERIDRLLDMSEMPAHFLELEITEGTVMDNPQRAITMMDKLRARGIHLAMDDFGTGYSSLAYLKKFPLNTLKIDKVFVDDINQSEKGRNMVSTIITIAHNLELSVVAEGVEEQSQYQFLKQSGCQQMQGYLYSKPLSTQDFEKLLKSQTAQAAIETI